MTFGCGVGQQLVRAMPDKAGSSEVQFRSEKLPCDSNGVRFEVACISGFQHKCVSNCYPWKRSLNSQSKLRLKPLIKPVTPLNFSSGGLVVTPGVDQTSFQS